jgi:hypothetical protein
MLLLEILGYYRLFHFKLFFYYKLFHPRLFFTILSNYNIWLLIVHVLRLLMVINTYSFGCYSINGYWWLLY